jgi:hypothetical protein
VADVAATPASSQSRNLQATGKARVGLGPTRDVVVIEGTTQTLAAHDVPSDMGDAFAAATGFDPRTLPTRYLYVRIHPRRMQAWRAADELEGRELMRDGRWLGA